MIIAGILCLAGLVIGLSYPPLALLPVSIVVVVGLTGLWLARDEFSAFSVFVLFGYLAALQSGYLAGAYFATRTGDDRDDGADDGEP